MSWLKRLQQAKSTSVLNEQKAKQVEAKTIAANDNEVEEDEFCNAHARAHVDVGKFNSEAEEDRFEGRVLRLQSLGADLLKAESLAERLLKRDRDTDDRRMCAECSNLAGKQCRNPQGAELGLPSHRTADVTPIRFMLQRCEGYKP